MRGRKITSVFVSTTGLTPDAKSFALTHGIKVVDGLELAKEFLEWGIIGIAIKGTDYYVFGPRATEPSARYNKDIRQVEIR